MDKCITDLLNWLAAALRRLRPERLPAAGSGWVVGTACRADGQPGGRWVLLKTSDLPYHLYIIGGSGSGKSTFLDLLFRNCIQSRLGCALVDAHGDLIRHEIAFLHEEIQRAAATSRPIDRRQIYLIEPHEEDAAVGLDILHPGSGPLAPHIEELIGILRRCWPDTTAAPRTENLLRHLLGALARAGLTLVEGTTFLTDAVFRSRVVSQLRDPALQEYWERFGQLSEGAQATWSDPTLTRFGALLADPRVRGMLGQREHALNLRRLMDSGGWLLVNLSRGQLKGSADLIGSLILRQIVAAAHSRADQPEAARPRFLVLVDEFQHFAGDSFEIVLSEARKFGVFFGLAHQYEGQLGRTLQDAIHANVGTKVVFATSAPDAAVLARHMTSGPAVQRMLVQLAPAHAFFCQRGKPDILMQVLPVAVPPVPEDRLDAFRAELRRQHGRPLAEVEAEIARRRAAIRSGRPPAASGRGTDDRAGDRRAADAGMPETPPPPVPEADDE